jgi:site-specific DNA-methyltransferase (adenine-specific)
MKQATGWALGRTCYRTEVLSEQAYADAFSDYEAFLLPRMQEAYRLLTARGSLYFHIDYRGSAIIAKSCSTACLGRENFLNENIWALRFRRTARTSGRPSMTISFFM